MFQKTRIKRTIIMKVIIYDVEPYNSCLVFK